jgi:hypothetical protein
VKTISLNKGRAIWKQKHYTIVFHNYIIHTLPGNILFKPLRVGCCGSLDSSRSSQTYDRGQAVFPATFISWRIGVTLTCSSRQKFTCTIAAGQILCLSSWNKYFNLSSTAPLGGRDGDGNIKKKVVF